MIGVLLAVPELDQETALVGGAGASGIRVVRRCVDAADLLAAATADPGSAVVVSPALPRLSADVVARLRTPSTRIVAGVADDEPGAALLRQWGIGSVVIVGPTAAATLTALAGVLTGSGGAPAAGGVWPTGCWETVPAVDPDVGGPSRGRLVAVWGPMGSPGRTTVAIGVAEAFAETGLTACVADADTYAPSVAMALGVLDDPDGLLLACRHADNGSLSESTLMSATRKVRPDLFLLTGLSRTDRWAELRSTALDRVWEAARSVFDVTIVDVGFCLEEDPGPGPLGRHRNAAALTPLAVADHVLAVGDASAPGAVRLAAGWPALARRVDPSAVTVVRNRSGGRDRDWDAAVRSAGVNAPLRSLPSDARALEQCWRRGRSLGEGARRSGIRRALAVVAGEVVPP